MGDFKFLVFLSRINTVYFYNHAHIVSNKFFLTRSWLLINITYR